MIINKKIHNVEISNLEKVNKLLLKKDLDANILIIDQNLKSNKYIKKLINKFGPRCLLIKGQEKIKSLDNYCTYIERILKIGVQRKSKLISIGGGTIGDFAGFLASSLLRGIDHYMIPSSLLAMVDSSIGGKTGLNSKYGKNLVGSFYLPEKVIICPELLNTLPNRELSCGFAEIIKYSLIKPNNFKKRLLKYDFKKNSDLISIIKYSIKTKIDYVDDFKEKSSHRSSRAILNFGHSIGHAIENSNLYKSNIKHGEAIALGMLIELKISEYLGFYNKPIDQTINLLKKFNLPTSYENYLSNDKIKKLMQKMKYDKKVSDNYINIICIDNRGGFIKKLSFEKLEKILTKIV